MKITALGELLIDYTSKGKAEDGIEIFAQNAGGAPANVLACLAKLGVDTAFIGKVGADMQGHFLQKTLANAGIDTHNVVFTADFFTTLAFVSLNEQGERQFAFSRKPGADTQLLHTEVDTQLLAQTDIFHFGSLSLTHAPARQATLFAVQQAKQNGAIISYDPNYRALLWENEQVAQDTMRSVLGEVQVLKISDEECALMTGYANPKRASQHLHAQGVAIVVVTLGAQGALVTAQGTTTHVPGFTPTAVRDTTGAGDSFWGGFLYQLAQSGCTPAQVTCPQACEFARFGNAVASLCVENYGAIGAMPSMACVLERMCK